MLVRMRSLPIALEITPPAAPNDAVLRRRALALGARPHCVNVISRPDRWPSLDASVRLREMGFSPVWHLPNRGGRISDVDAAIERALRAGIDRVLCIRGEHKAEDGLDTPKIREIVRRVAQRLPGARIGVTLNHHLGARALDNLWPKLEAGATSVQTQVTFELGTLAPLARAVARERPDVAIVPMLMPVSSADAARRVARRLSVPVPDALLRALAAGGAEAGWRHFARLAARLRADPLYAGAALMTRIDVTSEMAARLRVALG